MSTPPTAITHINTTTTTTTCSQVANVGNSNNDTTVFHESNTNTNDSEVLKLKKKSTKEKKRVSCLPITPPRCTLAPTPANTNSTASNSSTLLVFRSVPVE